MIFKRKSFHLFRNVGNETISNEELLDILAVYHTLDSLDPNIKTEIRIVPAQETTCKRGEEYCICFYSEKKDGYLRNIGYIGEQLDLYLVSKNIATLWYGIGKIEQESYHQLDFVIMMAIHKVSDQKLYRKNMFKSKRKPIEEIWEGALIEGVSDLVRFTPSACNTQPWFVRNKDVLKVFRYKKPGKRGIMPADKVSYYNRIDIGIFLCFMELCLTHNGYVFKRQLFDDSGDDELTLNAIYEIEVNHEIS